MTPPSEGVNASEGVSATTASRIPPPSKTEEVEVPAMKNGEHADGLVDGQTKKEKFREAAVDDVKEGPVMGGEGDGKGSDKEGGAKGEEMKRGEIKPEWIFKSPVDEPHPLKWAPPVNPAAPEVQPAAAFGGKHWLKQSLAPDASLPEWLSDECLPFLTLFDRHVALNPNKVAVSWVGLDGEIEEALTYAQLHATSASLAARIRLQWRVGEGERVVLVYPPGLHFLLAFLACLRASE